MRAAPRRRLRDARVPDFDRSPPPQSRDRRQAPGAAAPELVGLHVHVDAARATL